ncbi:hypothetical protein OAF62_02785 [Akkermansiaceae bacterium]|nr:hypothetical protein [Akkermansiaceae bacterium]
MNLKKTLLLVGLSSGLANADVEGTVSASYSSEYVYRGVNFGDNLTTLNITASGEAAGLTWHAGLLHGNSELGESDDGLSGGLLLQDITIQETRMTLGVSKSLTDSVSVNAGMIVTSYDLVDSDRREIYVGASTQLAGIDLSGTIFFNDSSVYSGDAYYELSASYHHCMGDGLGATLAVTYGNWDEDPFTGLVNALDGTNLAPFEDVDFFSISAALTKDFGDGVSGTLSVTHTISDVEEGGFQLTDDETVVGASVTFSF